MTDYAELRRISNEIDNHKPGASVVLRGAATELEAKAADVARLTAEVERLKNKKCVHVLAKEFSEITGEEGGDS